jgi:hypothetical protein
LAEAGKWRCAEHKDRYSAPKLQKPDDLPVQFPTRFEMVVNRKWDSWILLPGVLSVIFGLILVAQSGTGVHWPYSTLSASTRSSSAFSRSGFRYACADTQKAKASTNAVRCRASVARRPFIAATPLRGTRGG